MTDVPHPARYSPEVIDLLRWLLPVSARVHDPFAGTGERLGRLASDRSMIFTGTDIEPEFIVDIRVYEGDATDPSSYPPRSLCTVCGRTDAGPGMHLDKRELIVRPDAEVSVCRGHERGYTIVTSPVYPNGMADDFVASDDSTRRTYRTAKATITGDRRVALHQRNMGRWGYRGQPLRSTARMMYWHLADAAVSCWGEAERVIVNVSDFTEDHGRQVPVVGEWQRLLVRHGWVNQDAHEVPTRRYRNGANRDARPSNEVVIDARR